MTPSTIILTTLLLAVVYIASSYYATKRNNRKLAEQASFREHCELAKQRIEYIGKLRKALRESRLWLKRQGSGIPEIDSVISRIDELTTAVDTNGQPLRKETNASS